MMDDVDGGRLALSADVGDSAEVLVVLLLVVVVEVLLVVVVVVAIAGGRGRVL